MRRKTAGLLQSAGRTQAAAASMDVAKAWNVIEIVDEGGASRASGPPRMRQATPGQQIVASARYFLRPPPLSRTACAHGPRCSVAVAPGKRSGMASCRHRCEIGRADDARGLAEGRARQSRAQRFGR